MFHPGLGAIPSAAKQREEVKRIVLDAISAGTFTYTELLSAPEPWRTMALEALDGVTVQGSRPSYNGQGVQDWNGRPFRLIHVKPDGRIKVPVERNVHVPGSSVTKPERVWEDVGNIADVYDHPHNRQARQLLFAKGWPVRQTISNGNAIGEIVEWEWLQQAVAMGASARPGVVEMFEDIKNRMDAWEADRASASAVTAAAAVARSKKTNQSKEAATQP
jgi:hypothetical protein